MSDLILSTHLRPFSANFGHKNGHFAVIISQAYLELNYMCGYGPNCHTSLQFKEPWEFWLDCSVRRRNPLFMEEDEVSFVTLTYKLITTFCTFCKIGNKQTFKDDQFFLTKSEYHKIWFWSVDSAVVHMLKNTTIR